MKEKLTTKVSNEQQAPRFWVGAVSSRFLTFNQLYEACKIHSFLLLRFKSGHLMGINTKVADIARKKKRYPHNKKTEFIGFIPCDFQTYISKKNPFYAKQ
jgi:hypothetical protein